tara:strand:- start:300 stop:488 length:189 start_codon:yes stop_codon:yes gene_type:complete
MVEKGRKAISPAANRAFKADNIQRTENEGKESCAVMIGASMFRNIMTPLRGQGPNDVARQAI